MKQPTFMLAISLGVALGALAVRHSTALTSTPPTSVEANHSGAQIRALEAKVDQLLVAVQSSTNQVAAPAEKTPLMRAQLVRVQPMYSEEEIAALKSQVSEPFRFLGVDASGNDVRRIVFTELQGPDGGAIGSDLEFREVYGNRLVFRRADGRLAGFDTHEVHPGVLAHLGIDPALAAADQARIKKRLQDQRETARKRVAARQKVEAEERQRQNELYLDALKERLSQPPVYQPAPVTIVVQSPPQPQSNTYVTYPYVHPNLHWASYWQPQLHSRHYHYSRQLPSPGLRVTYGSGGFGFRYNNTFRYNSNSSFRRAY